MPAQMHTRAQLLVILVQYASEDSVKRSSDFELIKQRRVDRVSVK